MQGRRRPFAVAALLLGAAILAAFGGGRHSGVPNDIMSYTQTGAMPFFLRHPIRMLRRTLRRYLRSGELELTGT